MVVEKSHVTKIHYPIRYEYMEMDCNGDVKEAGTETYYLKVGVIRGGHPKFPSENALEILKYTALLGLFLDAGNSIVEKKDKLICHKENGDVIEIGYVTPPKDDDYVLDLPAGHRNVVYGVGNTDNLI